MNIYLFYSTSTQSELPYAQRCDDEALYTVDHIKQTIATLRTNNIIASSCVLESIEQTTLTLSLNISKGRFRAFQGNFNSTFFLFLSDPYAERGLNSTNLFEPAQTRFCEIEMPDKKCQSLTSMINILTAIHGLFFIIIKCDMEGAILSKRLDCVIS